MKKHYLVVDMCKEELIGIHKSTLVEAEGLANAIIKDQKVHSVVIYQAIQRRSMNIHVDTEEVS